MFYETFSPYLRDKQIECCTFNIIKQLIAMTQTKTFCFIEAKTNIYLIQHYTKGLDCFSLQQEPTENGFSVGYNLRVTK